MIIVSFDMLSAFQMEYFLEDGFSLVQLSLKFEIRMETFIKFFFI